MEKIIIERISAFSDIKMSDIKFDSLFEDDLKLDNIDLAEICLELEDKLKITFDYNMLFKIKTVGDLIYYIKGLI